MWYCKTCDKSNNIKDKSKHKIFISQKHKEKLSVLVKEYEFFRPDINKIDKIIFFKLGTVIINIFIYLNLDVYMELKRQTAISSMEYVLIKNSNKLLQKMVLYIN